MTGAATFVGIYKEHEAVLQGKSNGPFTARGTSTPRPSPSASDTYRRLVDRFRAVLPAPLPAVFLLIFFLANLGFVENTSSTGLVIQGRHVTFRGGKSEINESFKLAVDDDVALFL